MKKVERYQCAHFLAVVFLPVTKNAMRINKLVLIVAFVFLLGCVGQNVETTKEIKFSGGKTGNVTFEKVKESENETVFHVNFQNDEKVIKESTVEKQVEEIWEQMKAQAEKDDIEEALIKYIYLFDFDDEHQKPIYKIILFEATRSEQTKWKIRKVSE